ncbi:carboxymuconolactone decarboxylase family protein [Trinickia violacea]|nr:carboxymuconolactone decarboxylase family protein [Trinickia violacea]
MNIDSLEQAFSSGTASSKEQKLVALGVAISLRGDDCLAGHVRDALEAGATRDELRGAVSVALAIGGGLPWAYERRLNQALEVLDTTGGVPQTMAPAWHEAAAVRR